MNATRLIAVIAILPALIACVPTADEVAHLKEALPPGCTITDAGQYGDVDDVLIVHCKDGVANTAMVTQHHWQGKRYYSKETATVTIE